MEKTARDYITYHRNNSASSLNPDGERNPVSTLLHPSRSVHNPLDGVRDFWFV